MGYTSAVNKLSKLIIDADLAMGAHDISLGAAQTVDGKDVSELVGIGTINQSDITIDTDLAMGAHNITLSAAQTVDGKDVSGIETGATADQTGAEIKTLYEGQANAFTDTKNTKLAGIESNAKDDQALSEVSVDADLAMGAHSITLGAAQTVDGSDISVSVPSAVSADSANSVALSNVSVDADLAMGAHNITLGAAQTVDEADISVKVPYASTLKGVGMAAIMPQSIDKVASDDLRHSHDAEITGITSETLIIQKTETFTNGIKGTLRIKFDIAGGIAAGHRAMGRIYKNGVAQGAIQYATGTINVYVTKSQDIDVGAVEAGEVLQLYVGTEDAAYTCKIKNFRFYYTNDTFAPAVPVAATAS